MTTMNVFGNTCPICCDDLGAAHSRGAANVCRSCGCDAEAHTQLPAAPDLAPASRVWEWMAPDIQLQTSAPAALPNTENI